MFYVTKILPAILVCLVGLPVLSSCQIAPVDSCKGGDPLCNPFLALLLVTAKNNASLDLPCQGVQSGTFVTIVGTGNNEITSGVCALDDGDVLLSGYAESELSGVPVLNPHTNGVNDVFLARASSTGSLRWITYFGSAADENGQRLTQTGPDRFVITSSAGAAITSLHGLSPVEAHSGGGGDFMILAVNGSGSLLWYTFLGGTGLEFVSHPAYDEIEDRLYITGQVSAALATESGQAPLYSGQGLTDCALFRLNPATGALEWFTHVSGTGDESCSAVTTGEHGGPVVIGGSNSTSISAQTPLNAFSGSTGDDVFVASYDADGSPRWHTFLGTAHVNPEIGKGIVRLQNGSFATTSEVRVGISSSGGLTPLVDYPGPIGSYDALVAGFSRDGALQFFTYHGVSGDDDTTEGIFPTTDGGFVVTSLSNNYLPTFNGLTPRVAQLNGSEGMHFKYDAAGNLLWYSFNRGANSIAKGTPLSDGGMIITSELTSALSDYDNVAPNGTYVGNSDVLFFRINSEGLMR